jgi:type III pantothenate kinase
MSDLHRHDHGGDHDDSDLHDLDDGLDIGGDDFGGGLLGARGGAREKGPLVPAGVGLLAISVGNTNTRFVTYHGAGGAGAGHEHEGVSLPNADLVGLTRALVHAGHHLEDDERTAVVVASTNHRFRDELLDALSSSMKHEVYRVGVDVQVPIVHALSDEAAEKTGQDRLLNALAAFEIAGGACAVVSAGTAMTVDFVDGAGTFQGGAILPGARMWLRSMHEHTSALPSVEPGRPDADAFGRDTKQAMLHGLYHGMRGAVRGLVERYAEAYAAYPRVIATGGDAMFLFEGDDLIERIDPDLTLKGIADATRGILEGE